MYYYEDSMAKHMEGQGYTLITRKPWNVKEGDVFILRDSTTPPYMNDRLIPVIIHTIDSYAQFYNPDPYNNGQYARTAWRFYHKPLMPEDIKYLYNWHKMENWNRFDDVEIWRKKAPKVHPTKIFHTVA